MWVEHHGVGDPSAACTRNVAPVVSVMVEGRPNVESMGTMGCPRSSFICSVMDDYFASQGGHGGLVEIKGTMDLCICREFRVHAGGPEEIQCDVNLRH